jgi:hypothetical protein
MLIAGSKPPPATGGLAALLVSLLTPLPAVAPAPRAAILAVLRPSVWERSTPASVDLVFSAGRDVALLLGSEAVSSAVAVGLKNEVIDCHGRHDEGEAAVGGGAEGVAATGGVAVDIESAGFEVFSGASGLGAVGGTAAPLAVLSTVWLLGSAVVAKGAALADAQAAVQVSPVRSVQPRAAERRRVKAFMSLDSPQNTETRQPVPILRNNPQNRQRLRNRLPLVGVVTKPPQMPVAEKAGSGRLEKALPMARLGVCAAHAHLPETASHQLAAATGGCEQSRRPDPKPA